MLHTLEEGKSIGLSYFKERGFTEETIKKFELGYSKELWDGLLNEALNKGYKKELLSEAGLIIDKDEKTYDRFRSRVIFPIHNVSGKTIAFGGRKLSSTDKSAKYINSPETDLYHKNKVLYGISQAKNSIRKEDNCFIVEGYTDVISMHQAGIENVVATSGTALTDGQINLVRRYTSNITVIFDGDNAGAKASLRGFDILIEEIEASAEPIRKDGSGGLMLNAVLLPDGDDPDSFVKKYSYSDCIDHLNESTISWVEFKTGILLKDSGNDPTKIAIAAKEVAKSLAKIKDPVSREAFQKKCSQMLGVTERSLISEINRNLIQNRKDKRRHEIPNQSEVSSFPMEQEGLIDQLDISKIIEFQERESVRVLVNYGKSKISIGELQDQYLIDYFLNEADEIQFMNETYRKIVGVFQEKLKEGEIIGREYLLNHEDEKVRKTVIDLSADKYELSENWSKKYNIHVPRETEFLKNLTYTNVVRLKFRIIQQLIQEETEKLKHTTNEAETDELLDDINELKMVSVEIAKILGNVLVG